LGFNFHTVKIASGDSSSEGKGTSTVTGDTIDERQNFKSYKSLSCEAKNEICFKSSQETLSKGFYPQHLHATHLHATHLHATHSHATHFRLCFASDYKLLRFVNKYTSSFIFPRIN